MSGKIKSLIKCQKNNGQILLKMDAHKAQKFFVKIGQTRLKSFLLQIFLRLKSTTMVYVKGLFTLFRKKL